jgi:hypothetical protein
MNISKECLILNLQISSWQGYKLDRVTTAKVTNEAGAKSDAARVNKHIVSKECLTKITTAEGRVRVHFYDATLPWKDNGDRLLPRKNFVGFIQQHEKLVGEHKQAVRDFLDGGEYETAREQAEFRMGELFNPEDYPSVEDLRSKFQIKLDIDAVSRAYDYRLESNDAMIQARVNSAIANLWKRLADPLEKFAERMNDPDGKFRVNTIENLREMAELTKELNFTGDEELDRIRQEIENKLAGYAADDLRKDDTLRASVGAEADRILDQMRGFMRSMGSED